MKSANVKIRRMTAVVLMLLAGLLMCITGLLPSEASAEETSTTTSTTSGKFSNILNLKTTETAAEDVDAAETPYGTAAGETFMLSTENELLLQTSHDINNSTKNNKWKYYDTLNTSSAVDVSHIKNNDYTTGNDYQALSFSESVAFDPTGTGRDDHVAYVGYYEAGTVYEISLYIVNTTTGTVSARTTVCNAEWMHDKSPYQYQAQNLFSITAGDYDGDGKDTVVVYGCGEENNIALTEYSYSDSGIVLKAKLPNEENKYNNGPFNPSYFNASDSDKKLYSSKEITNKLGACLSTGDINGDGVDDLGVISYCNRYKGSAYASDQNLCNAYLWVGFGAKDQKLESMCDKASGHQSAYVDNGNAVGSSNAKVSLYAPTISFGDIDGDGVDNLVAAGIRIVLNTGSTSIDQTKTVISAFSYNSTKENTDKLSKNSFTEVSSNQLTQYKSGAKDSDNAAAPVATACVAVNGQTNAEFVFVNGTIYDMTTFTPEEKSTITYLTTDDFNDGPTVSGSQKFNRATIQSVAVGNFDGNDAGRE